MDKEAKPALANVKLPNNDGKKNSSSNNEAENSNKDNTKLERKP
jgi:hypothetical protein